MNFQQSPNIQHHHHQFLEEIGGEKEEHLDKTTHQLFSSYSHHYQLDKPENSPLKGSFFFTPNSPKHFQLELHPQGGSSSYKNTQKHFQPSTSLPSISQKIDFGMEDEESNFEQGEEKQLLASSGKSSKRSGPNRSSKNSKGLRNLSESVYRIVSQLEVTRYKEVADRLVSETTDQVSSCKDEHNIKRRVYDALNVLISAGILKKEGKEVSCNQPPCKSKRGTNKHIHNAQYSEKLQFQSRLRRKTELLRQKEAKLRKLEAKKKVIESIISRNKHQKAKEEYILRFPLISAMVTEDFYKLSQPAENIILFSTQEQPPLLGDVDMLVQINQGLLQADKLLDSVWRDDKVEGL